MFLKKFLSIVAAALFLAACSSDSNDPVPTGSTAGSGSADVAVIHASADAPAVDVIVNGGTFTSGLEFGQVRSSTIIPGALTVEVEGIVPGGNATVIGPVDLALGDGEKLTIIASNDVAAIEPIVISEARASVSASDVRVRVVHTAPAAPMVDVYVSAPGTDITGEAPTGTFSYGEILGPLTIPAGAYQIQVAVAGDPTAVVYDSGALDLAGGSDLTILAIPDTGAASAPISLLVVNDVVATEILDASATAAVRVVHASPDAPNVDVVAGDDFSAPVVSDLAYTQQSAQLDLAPGSINVKVVPTGSETPVVIDADLALAAGESYRVYATGLLADIAPLVLVDDLRAIATEARLRIVHASPSAGNVDVYLVEPGTDITTVAAALSDVPFRAESGYLSVAPGDYDVVVTPAGSDLPAIGPATVSLEAGGIYTAAARDEFGSGTPLGLILLDDF
ncbi:MAG: DUF4397 domain-containing protein [Pseudomonadaceae bacterium]|nr:DUF4397 domain-containing protein [Pseudomonadaceae bacterium]